MGIREGIMMSLNLGCQHCGNKSLIIDSVTNEIICSNCGVVNGKEESVNGYVSDDVLAQRNTWFLDTGSAKLMNTKKNSGIKKVTYNGTHRYINNIVQSCSYDTKKLNEANLILNSIIKTLPVKVTDSMYQITIYYIRKAIKMRMAKGRDYTTLTMTCLLLAARELNIALTVTDLTKSKVERKKIFQILKEMNLDYGYKCLSDGDETLMTTTEKSYMSVTDRACNILRISHTHKRNIIKFIISIIRTGLLSGSKPEVIIGSCIDIYARQYVKQTGDINMTYTTAEIVRATKVTVVSIRKRKITVAKVMQDCNIAIDFNN